MSSGRDTHQTARFTVEDMRQPRYAYVSASVATANVRMSQTRETRSRDGSCPLRKSGSGVTGEGVVRLFIAPVRSRTFPSPRQALRANEAVRVGRWSGPTRVPESAFS